MRKPTIKDVAAEAGVSAATVSRILTSSNSAIRISDATKQRVLAVARRLNYTPNALATGLRSQQTRMIGVIVPDAALQYCGALVSALEPALGERDYDFLLTQSRSSVDVHRSSRTFERYRVDGVIVVADLHDDTFLYEYLNRLHGHAVGLARQPTPGLPCVTIDNRLGVQMAINHLVDSGRRRIAYVGGSRGWDPDQRLRAYQACLTDAGLAHEPELIAEDGTFPDLASGARATQRLLASAKVPSAILYFNDEMAIGGMAVLQQHGYAVPGDIAVVGFDDIPWASYCSPSLTTVHQPIQAMVERVIDVLINMIEGEPIQETHASLVFAPRLIVRGSTLDVSPNGPFASTHPVTRSP